jgi:signal peptidase I
LTDHAPTPSSADPATEQERTDWLAEIRNLALLLLAVLFIHSFIAKPFYIPSASMMPGLLEGDRLVVSKYPYGWSFASVSFHLAPRFSGRLFGRPPERGDIAIVEPLTVRTDYIKRVIGLPGDTIEVRNGRLILNGRPVKSEVMPERLLPVDANVTDRDCFISGRIVQQANGKLACAVQIVRETLPSGVYYDTIDANFSSPGDNYGPITVPAGHVFLMGDNRDNSSDSRFPISAMGLGGPVPLENLGGRAEFITFSLDGTAQWYNPISWFTSMRPGRAGTSLRPQHTTPPTEPSQPPAN